MYPFELSPCTAVLSEAWAKLRDWASVAGRGRLLLSGSVAHASLKTAVCCGVIYMFDSEYAVNPTRIFCLLISLQCNNVTTCYFPLPPQELVDTNQGLLCALGVSHPALDRTVALAALRGFHAKLTGAGGGGCAFALLAPHASKV